MLIILSPSKTQDFEAPAPVKTHSVPALLDESELLVKELRKLPQNKIAALMDISEKLAALNHGRYQYFKTPFTLKNAKQALYAFQGDVYDGLKAETFDEQALAFATDHLRILSGLYGVLRPLDLIQPYRLEMKIKLKNPRGKDLYHFWDKRLAENLNNDMGEPRVLINLASEEYFKGIKANVLNARIITPQFKEKKAKGYQMIALFAKKARGSMAHYICAKQIDDPDALKFFAEDGYRYNVALSSPESPVYTRG
jgi:cytoplasmic iron level regulating protein YaaA (DUF328/UPF0246 family)